MGNGVAAMFDATIYHRQKAWRLERELAACRERETQLVRLLGLALEVATAHETCGPLDLLRELERIT